MEDAINPIANGTLKLLAAMAESKSRGVRDARLQPPEY
jgi:hypothetical protein